MTKTTNEAKTSEPVKTEAAEPVTFYSISTNFNPTIVSPKKILVAGEYQWDHGKTVTFEPIGGTGGAGWGSRYTTSDPFEIEKLTALMKQMPQYMSKEYRVPPTAQTYYNVDHEQLRLQESQAAQAVVVRDRLQAR